MRHQKKNVSTILWDRGSTFIRKMIHIYKVYHICEVVSKQVLGIPTANQARPGQARIMTINTPGHDWSSFVHLGRSHLNHRVAGCRTGLSVTFTSRSIPGYDRPWTFLNRVCACRIWGFMYALVESRVLGLNHS